MNKEYVLRMPDCVSEDFVREIIDDDTVGEFKSVAEQLNLTAEQAQGVWEWMVTGAAGFVGDLNAASECYCRDTEEKLREIFGKDFEAKRKGAVDLIKKYGDDDLIAFLNNSGCGNCRELAAFLMRLADATKEDAGLAGEKAAAFSSEDRLKAEISKMMALPAYMQAGHPEHDTVVQNVYRLRKRLFNEE